MTHLDIHQGDRTIRARVAKVADVIHLMEQQYERDRLEMIKNLNDCEVPANEKMSALKELAAEKGQVSTLMKSAFTLQGAIEVLKYSTEPDDHKYLEDIEVDRLVVFALQVLGFTASTEEEGTEEQSGKAIEPVQSTKP